jgi:hypothetical protein
MRATSVSVNIRYSRPMADGSYKTVELGCEATLSSSGEDWQEAQATLYKQLGEQMRYVFNGSSNGKPVQKQPKAETPAPKPIHWCEAHQTEYKRFEKDNKVWYSHKAPDGKWCKESH